MKRLLTAGIFSTILGIVGAGTANASIVSSGFLDEKLTEMTNATTLQLDTKANQSDVILINMEVDPDLWKDQRESEVPWSITGAATIVEELFPNFVDGPYVPDSISYTLLTSLNRIDIPGIAGFTNKLLNGWTDENGVLLANPGLRGIYKGWLDKSTNTTYLGVKDLNTKTGSYLWGPENGRYKFSSIPYREELFPETSADKSLAGLDMATTILYNYQDRSFPGLAGVTDKLLNGWTDSAGKTYLGIKDLNTKTGTWPGGPLRPSKGLTNLLPETINMTFPTSIKDLMIDIYDGYWSISNLAEAVYYGNGYRQKDPALVVKGLRQITDEIGNLPSGRFTPFPAGDNLFPVLNQPLTYPTSLAELITAIYGNSETGTPGLLAAITMGFPFDFDGDGSPDDYIGLVQNHNLAKTADEIIGTLPTQISGNDTTWARYGFETPIELPTTVGGMFDMLFHDERNNSTEMRFSLSTIMGRILGGFLRDDGSAVFYGLYDLTDALKLGNNRDNYPLVTAVKANTAAIEKIGTVPDGQTVAGMATTAKTTADSAIEKIGTVPDGQTVAGMATTAKTTADSAIEKIGTLPTEYATVGAALSAIKGIAEEAKTAALAAIPDPKQEGSSGKFVLTVDIIGDNATYRWEKIDRESEPTTTE